MRAPLVRLGTAAGLAIAEARTSQVYVDSTGALVAERDGVRRVLCAAGAATRVAYASADQIPMRRFTPWAYRGIVLVRAGDGTATALNVVAYWGLGQNLQEPDILVAAGFSALAEALGLAVEPADASDLEVARSLRRRDLHPVRRPGASEWLQFPLGLLAAVLAFFTWPLADAGLGWAATLAALLPVGWYVGAFWQRRRRVLALVTTPPAPGSRVAVDPDPAAVTTGRIRDSHLQVGADDVVIRTAGTEWWLPGPSRGGATRLFLHPDTILLADRRDRPLLALERAVWESRIDVIADAFRAGGGDVIHAAEPLSVPVAITAGQDRARLGVMIDDPDNGAGNLALPVVAHLSAVMLLFGSIAAAITEPLAAPLVLGGLACVALACHATWSYSSWMRGQRRPVRKVRG